MTTRSSRAVVLALVLGSLLLLVPGVLQPVLTIRGVLTKDGLTHVAPMMLDTSFISGSSIPSVAGPGVPTRIPEGSMGGCGSNGMPFLLIAMPISSQTASACLPPIPSGRTSQSDRSGEKMPPLSTIAATL